MQVLSIKLLAIALAGLIAIDCSDQSNNIGDADGTSDATDGENGTDLDAEFIDAGDDDGGEADASDQDHGDAGVVVEYRGCEHPGAITRFYIYRIDLTNSICTMVWIEENFGGPCQPLGLISEFWCLSNASMSNDIASCEALGSPSNAIWATAVKGTFNISSGSMVDIDVELEFPPSGGSLPETVNMKATNCEARCAPEDCRR